VNVFLDIADQNSIMAVGKRETYVSKNDMYSPNSKIAARSYCLLPYLPQ
jgi:hypothetical protein